MRLLLALLLGYLLCACSMVKTPEQKLARLIAENPRLVADTVIKTVTDTLLIKEVRFEKEYITKRDTIADSKGLDTLLAALNGKVDAASLALLRSDMHRFLNDRKGFSDTVTVTENGISVKIWQTAGGVLKMAVVRDEIKAGYTKEETILSVEPVQELSAKNNKWFWFSMGLLVLFALLLLIYRK
jgi:hypothetical protein